MPFSVDAIFGEQGTRLFEVTAGTEVRFDVADSISHTRSKKVTQHPVEDGSQVADHIEDMPDEIQITAFISQTPDSIQESITASDTRAEDVYQQFNELFEAKKRLTVITGRETHEDMVISRVTRPRTAQTGDGVQLTIDMVKIRTAVTEITDAPVRSQRGAKRKLGKKPKKPATGAQSQSVAAKIFDRVAG